MIKPLVLFLLILVAVVTILSSQFEMSLFNEVSKDKTSSESFGKPFDESFTRDVRHDRQERLLLKKDRTLVDFVELEGQRKYKNLADEVEKGQILIRVRRSSSYLPLNCSAQFSCRNKCFDPRKTAYYETLSCYCDTDCEFFKDCCSDFKDVCREETTNTTAANFTQGKTENRTSSVSNPANKTTLIHKVGWYCFPLKKNLVGAKGIWMIGSCPLSWPKDDVFYRCINYSAANTITKDNYQYLPVYTSDGTVYHNRFCAQCNGEDLNKTKSYDVILACNMSSNASRHNCTVEGWRPANGQPRRYCLDVLSACPYWLYRERCENGRIGIVNDDRYLFKNIHCAKCYSGLKNLRCGPNMTGFTGNINVPSTPPTMPPMMSTLPPRPQSEVPTGHIWPTSDSGLPKPFDAILNFHSQPPPPTPTPITLTCPPGKVFDRYNQVCRETLNNVPTNEPKPTYKGHVIAQYSISLFLRNYSHCYQCIENSSLAVDIARFFRVSELQVLETTLDNSSWILRFHLRMKENETVYTKRMFQKIANFTLPFNISLAGEWFTVVNSTSTRIQCSSLQAYNASEYTISKDGSFVTINKTGEVIQPKDYYVNESSANESQGIIVCRHFIPLDLNCSFAWVSLRGAPFLVLENQSIFVNGSQRLYDPSSYLWQNQTLFICENFSRSYQIRILRFASTNNYALSIMTLTGLSMSIVSLVLVLITYSLFSELRTPPGINLMNLSTSILLAQFLWLVGSGQTDRPMVCTAIAVLLHYLFLVSFAWTSIIAFDTWRAFTAKGKLSMKGPRLRYIAFGWLSVLVYVGLCVVMDTTKIVDIGYQSSQICWMSNPSSILYFFAIPVALILLLNIVLYCLTTKAIHVTESQARFASDRKKSFGIYVRIASAMGFTWIFGFIAPFGFDFFQFAFVFFNTLQGVYIGVAFVFNKRVMKLYRRLLFGKENKASQGATSKTTGIENTALDTKL